LRVFLAFHETFHQVCKKTILLLLSFDQVADTWNVFRSAKNVAHEHVQVLMIALSLFILELLGWTVANRSETKYWLSAKTNILVKFLISIHQVCAKAFLLLVARL